MVCVACFVMPVLCWVWFTFVMPLIYKAKAILYPKSGGNAQDDASSSSPHPGLDLKSSGGTCPFATKNKIDQASSHIEAKKVN